jgi:hypothetical protein
MPEFRLDGSGESRAGCASGRAMIYLNGIQIAKVQFLLDVGAAYSNSTKTTRIRKAFASHASADRDEVLARLQGIRKAGAYLDIFFDVLKLRSGQTWQEEIERLIPVRKRGLLTALTWTLFVSGKAFRRGTPRGML